MSVWLTVDPGLGGTGYAVWNTGTPSRRYRKALLDAGQIVLPSTNKFNTPTDRAMFIAWELTTRIQEEHGNNVVRAYVEEPAYMGGPTARRGDLVKLTLTAGILVSSIRNAMKCPVHMVRVIDWKGNAPKEIVGMRVCQLMGWSADNLRKDNHKLDAVGIGLHCLGIFR